MALPRFAAQRDHDGQEGLARKDEARIEAAIGQVFVMIEYRPAARRRNHHAGNSNYTTHEETTGPDDDWPFRTDASERLPGLETWRRHYHTASNSHDWAAIVGFAESKRR